MSNNDEKTDVIKMMPEQIEWHPNEAQFTRMVKAIMLDYHLWEMHPYYRIAQAATVMVVAVQACAFFKPIDYLMLASTAVALALIVFLIAMRHGQYTTLGEFFCRFNGPDLSVNWISPYIFTACEIFPDKHVIDLTDEQLRDAGLHFLVGKKKLVLVRKNK